jgi:hypothetical protein
MVGMPLVLLPVALAVCASLAFFPFSFTATVAAFSSAVAFAVAAAVEAARAS